MSEQYRGSITTIDQQLAKWLGNIEADSLVGKVHSIFNTVINVRSIDQNNLLTLALDEVVSSPWMMKTADKYLFESLKSNIALGDSVILLKKNIIKINQTEWDYKNAKCSFTKINEKSSNELIPNEAFSMIIYEFTKEQGKNSGLVSAWEKYTVKDYHVNLDENMYTEFFLQAIRNINKAIEEKDNDAVLTYTYGLVGLGVGLTPSGDDFLLGCLAVWHLFESPLIEYFKESDWIEIVKKRSTTISAFMLGNGVNGYVNQALSDLLEHHQEKDLTTYLAPFLNIGATSGTDMLIGVIFAYEQINYLYGRQKNGFKSNDRKKCLS